MNRDVGKFFNVRIRGNTKKYRVRIHGIIGQLLWFVKRL